MVNVASLLWLIQVRISFYKPMISLILNLENGYTVVLLLSLITHHVKQTFEAIRRIKVAGGFFSFDPNLRESLWASLDEMKSIVMDAVALADVLKFSEEELTLLTNTDSLEKAFEKVTALYPEKLIIVTLGKDGALYHLEGKKRCNCRKSLTTG